jgi:hypothetical protein
MGSGGNVLHQRGNVSHVLVWWGGPSRQRLRGTLVFVCAGWSALPPRPSKTMRSAKVSGFVATLRSLTVFLVKRMSKKPASHLPDCLEWRTA